MNYEIIKQMPIKERCKYCTARHRCPNFNQAPSYHYQSPICERFHPERWFDIEAYRRDRYFGGIESFQFSANEQPEYKQQVQTILGEVKKEMPKIERIVYSNPATIVWFADGEKVVVKCHNEEFDKEKGVAMAIARKLYSRSEFVKIIEGGENQLAKRLDKIFKETAKLDIEANREAD